MKNSVLNILKSINIKNQIFLINQYNINHMNYIYHNKAKFLDQLLLYNEIRSLLSNDESQNYPKSSLDDILDHKLNLSKIFDLKIEENYGISRIILYNTIQKDKNTIVMDVLEEPFRDEQNFNKFIRHIPNILQVLFKY
ncbi:hypothetical protein RirG_157190 [Rhizophagus irregularis DAOM 197198w]|uniref:Uncharacterized protein n=1 Tax=Rhizophagus irregularis (strain DAOM 197198w) TaxID=1432141 RepID=A0A015K629_RHIIW|nr:hypothetical protein RirG_157190 [Rhizophagus irregularis DAOM 197198w]